MGQRPLFNRRAAIANPPVKPSPTDTDKLATKVIKMGATMKKVNQDSEPIGSNGAGAISPAIMPKGANKK
jgi:hypothetical protein